MPNSALSAYYSFSVDLASFMSDKSNPGRVGPIGLPRPALIRVRLDGGIKGVRLRFRFEPLRFRLLIKFRIKRGLNRNIGVSVVRKITSRPWNEWESALQHFDWHSHSGILYHNNINHTGSLRTATVCSGRQRAIRQQARPLGAEASQRLNPNPIQFVIGYLAILPGCFPGFYPAGGGFNLAGRGDCLILRTVALRGRYLSAKPLDSSQSP